MTYAEKFVAAASEVGLETGVCEKDLVHVVLPGTTQRNCQVSGDGGRQADHPISPTTRVCMWCRDLPSWERRYLTVAGR